MSARQDNERLRREVEDLTAALKESRSDAAAHLRNVESLAAKATRTDEAETALARTHRDRDAAYKRIAALEEQAETQDVVLIRFVAEHLSGTSTAGMVLARDLADRLAKAGCSPVGAEVGLPAQTGVSS